MTIAAKTLRWWPSTILVPSPRWRISSSTTRCMVPSGALSQRARTGSTSVPEGLKLFRSVIRQTSRMHRLASMSCSSALGFSRRAERHNPTFGQARSEYWFQRLARADKTIVFKVNHDALTRDDIIVSNGSCTTNVLAPVAKVLNDLFGIERGYMTTVHAYTGDQPTLDTVHKDLYRARAAALSMIPTSTGAANAIGLVLPELRGKLHGSSIRVPTPNVSVVDLSVSAAREVSIEEVNDAIRQAAEGSMQGVLATTSEPLVSIDLTHRSESAIVALPQTDVVDGRMVRVLAWYDNEWSFATRMADTAVAMGKLI